jgi:type I restriction enzyme S subunit
MTAHLPLKQTYKQTDLGVIPSDWELAPLEKFWSVTDCKHVTAEFVQSGFPIASIRETQSRFIDLSEANKTTEAFYLKLVEGGRKPRAGDLIFSRNATVGEVAQVQDTHPPFAMGQDVCLLRKRAEVQSSDYLQFFLKSELGVRQLENLMVGSTFRRVNVQQIKALRIFVPPPREQNAISAALSDADDLIVALEALIEKKRNIKQAAMQQLLTGRTCLNGFQNPWVTKRLGDVAHIKTGKRNNEDKVEDGAYPLFVRSQTVERINTYSYDCEAVLVPGEGGIGNIFHYINGKFDCHQRVYKISHFDSTVCGKFIYFCMVHGFHKQATRNSVKATVDSLRLPTFQDFEFSCPELAAQIAIANILTDMDAEISALELKRDKATLIRDGMTQDLITGKVRLI